MSTPARKIIHIDMDCFFVSVGLKKYPELRGLPVAVCHSKGKGPVSRKKEDMESEMAILKEKYKHSDKRSVDINSGEGENPGKISTFNLIDTKSSMGEVASCSYEAREKGVKNGTFLGAALKICPELKTIPYDFEAYQSISMDLYNIVARLVSISSSN